MNFFRNLSIVTKLIILFLLMGIGSTIIVGVYSYYSARRSLIDRTFDQLTSIRVVKKNRIEDFFSDRFRDINLISKTNEVREIAALINNCSSQNQIISSKEYDQFLNMYVKAYGYYDKFIITDKQKNIIYTSGMVSDSLHYNKLSKPEYSCIRSLLDSVSKKKSSLFFDFRIDPFNQNKASYYIVTPILDDNKILTGCIALSISTKAINNIMLENSSVNGLGETGESYLVGQDFLMRSDSRFIPRSLMKQMVKTTASRKALSGVQGIEIIDDYRSIPVLSSYSDLKIPGIHWAIIAEIDLKEAMIPVIKIRNDILFLSMLLVIFILGITYVFARTISQPIIRLKNASVKVGEGDFDTRVDISGRDEIGALAESFNSMTSKLKSTTDELHEREERLRHFYEATVDGIILHEHSKPLLVNHALSVLTGFSEDELMKKETGQIFIPFEENDMIADPQDILAYESSCTSKSGKKFPVEIQQGYVEFKGRKIYATVLRDISKRKEVESELKEEREKRLSALIDGQEMERQRMSRELHDGLGQFLIAIKLKLENIISTQQDNKEPLLEVQEMFNTTIDEVRKISDNLMPSVLKEFGLETALSNLCKLMEHASNIRIQFESLPLKRKADIRISTYLYRISQEALNNMVKHSHATEASIELLEIGSHIELIIKDNGIGFDYSPHFKSQGNGIYNMHERVSIIGGTIEIKSKPGEGTMIDIKIPVYE
jgi:PAS domain S-box-containing protein